MAFKRVLRVQLLLGVALLAAALAAFACGGDDEEVQPTAPPSGATSVRVVLDEWSVTPNVSSVPAGRVTFEAVNEGAAPHELVVLKTDLPADGLIMQTDGGKVDEEASAEMMWEIEEFPAGRAESATYELSRGKYVLFCNISGHYKLGMFVGFQVQ
ncbi:MAG: hypothetical protein EXR48_00720 [Dehalococcoidia bacterium]|nr:hypothetical protein [Dehalococcoidia bacterium]